MRARAAPTANPQAPTRAPVQTPKTTAISPSPPKTCVARISTPERAPKVVAPTHPNAFSRLEYLRRFLGIPKSRLSWRVKVLPQRPRADDIITSKPTMFSVLAEHVSSLEFEPIRGMARSLTLCLPYLPPFKPGDLRYQCGFRGRNSFKKPQASNRAFYPARPRPPRGGTGRQGGT